MMAIKLQVEEQSGRTICILQVIRLRNRGVEWEVAGKCMALQTHGDVQGGGGVGGTVGREVEKGIKTPVAYSCLAKP